MASSALISDTDAWKDLKVTESIFTSKVTLKFKRLLNLCMILNMHCLQALVQEIKAIHLRDLMSDAQRCQSMIVYD